MISGKVLMILLICVKILVILFIFCVVLMIWGRTLVILLIWDGISNDFGHGFTDSHDLCLILIFFSIGF